MSVSEKLQGNVEFLGGSKEEVTATLRETVLTLLQEGFDDYPDFPFRALTRFFELLLSNDEKCSNGAKFHRSQEESGFLPPLPLEMEIDVASLIADWVLRDIPKRIADLGSGGDALTAALADRRDEGTNLYLLDLPSQIARVGRLMASYRYPEASLEDIQILPYASLSDDRQALKVLDEFTDLPNDRSDWDDIVGGFEAVISGLIPDTIQGASEDIRDRMSELGIARGYTGLSTYLAVEGMQCLSELRVCNVYLKVDVEHSF